MGHIPGHWRTCAESMSTVAPLPAKHSALVSPPGPSLCKPTAQDLADLRALLPPKMPRALREALATALGGIVADLRHSGLPSPDRLQRDDAQALSRAASDLLRAIQRTDAATLRELDLRAPGFNGISEHGRRAQRADACASLVSALWDLAGDVAQVAEETTRFYDGVADPNNRPGRIAAEKLASRAVRAFDSVTRALPPKSAWFLELVQRMADLMNQRVEIGRAVLFSAVDELAAEYARASQPHDTYRLN